jgi:hypothetical protein
LSPFSKTLCGPLAPYELFESCSMDSSRAFDALLGLVRVGNRTLRCCCAGFVAISGLTRARRELFWLSLVVSGRRTQLSGTVTLPPLSLTSSDRCSLSLSNVRHMQTLNSLRLNPSRWSTFCCRITITGFGCISTASVQSPTLSSNKRHA